MSQSPSEGAANLVRPAFVFPMEESGASDVEPLHGLAAALVEALCVVLMQGASQRGGKSSCLRGEGSSNSCKSVSPSFLISRPKIMARCAVQYIKNFTLR